MDRLDIPAEDKMLMQYIDELNDCIADLTGKEINYQTELF